MSKDLGDFQTPPALVNEILKSLEPIEVWTRVFEPTCGEGNFIKGLLGRASPPREIQGIEIQQSYLNKVQSTVALSSSTQITLKCGNIFDLNLRKELQWKEKGPLLIIGNPPWVTNSQQGVLNSENLPNKINLKKLSGLEALTGESNFDIAEYIWLKLIQELASEEPTIALLCKTSVARNVLKFASDTSIPISSAWIKKIDAKKWFHAAVDACLFHIKVGSGNPRYEMTVYPDLVSTQSDFIIGMTGKRMIADVKAYNRLSFIDGSSTVTWRQGIKHDAASVVELTYDANGDLRNKLDEVVTVESDYIYPLLKSSDLFNGVKSQRAVIVPQRQFGEDTSHLEKKAPRLWEYLTSHIHFFHQRKSSIYDHQPPFTFFGIGEYSFASYKVSVSGLHKSPRFRAVAPVNGRPVMFDDTCYILPCYSAKEAAFFASLLNDPECLNFIRAIIFLDSKRPVTKKLLQRINLAALLNYVDQELFLSRIKIELKNLGCEEEQQEFVWPLSLKQLL